MDGDILRHESVRIKVLEPDLRPREKALRLGIKALTDVELMAIIFSTGIQGKGVLDLCSDILSDNKGHLSRVASLGAREFMKRYKGIGPAKALTLLAGLELGARAASDARRMDDPVMCTASVAYEYMREHLDHLDHEEFWVLFLKQNNKAIREMKIGQGGLSSTSVDVRIIMREALALNASGMILFHNHPSGNLKASASDISLTKKIVQAASLFDIRVLDHIIAGHGSFLSLVEQGSMPSKVPL